MAKLHELLTRDAEGETILTDIYRTVIDAVRTDLIGTNLLSRRYGPGDIPGSTLSVVAQTKNALIVHQVGEGQEIPISVDAVFNFTTTPAKYGVRPIVTREMQEDSQFAFIERNLREAGYQMGRKLDSLILTAARAGAGATVTGGAAITVANITTAMQTMESNDYTPTDFIVGASVGQDLRNIDTFTEANKAGVNDPSRSLIGTIFGMRVWRTNQLANATDALVIDRDWALYLAEKRPVTVERYNDVTKQLDGVVLSSRWQAGIIPTAAAGTTTNAIQLITTT